MFGCQRRGPVVDLLLDRRAQVGFARARPADDLLADGESGRDRACASCIGQAQMTYGIDR